MTANTTRSRKSKGMEFQKEVISIIQSFFESLTDNDLRSVPGGVQGPDIWMSEVASTFLPFDFECKRVEKLNIDNAYAQVRKRTEKSGKVPIVVFRKNRTIPKVCIGLHDFLNILTRVQHEM